MLPMIQVRERLGTLLAGDATTLAPATTGNRVHLIGAAFALSELLQIADLDLLQGNGLDPIDCKPGAQEVALDPTTNQQILTLVPAAGSGFRWVTSGNLPQPVSVYGAALTNDVGDVLLAAMQLPRPIVLNEPGYQVDIDPQTMTFVLSPIN